MNTSYRLARLMDAEELTIMSMELYAEINSRKDFTDNKIVATLRFYEQHSNMGEVLMIECDGDLAGYSIIFRFWSHEYGGLMLGVDELYIKKKFRRSGIAKQFIDLLIATEQSHPQFVGIELEAHSNNTLANKLFASVGMPQNNNAHYIKLLKQ
jgi:ribosomal protein S18 acetylase RimI-like enzyme